MPSRANDLAAALRRTFGALTPRQLMLGGWLGFMVYAFPGYMSFDSVIQLREARWGYFSDGHPPAMAELWRIVDCFIAGPLGMLVIQSVCVLVGGYLIFKRRMPPRAAAIIAVLLLWFPPVSSLVAVIWKDSQMIAFMLLGTGLMLQDSRRSRVFGLVAMAAGTAMRHNALAMTLPIVVLLFVWDSQHRFVKRYGIAIVAWLAVTASANLVTRALTDNQRNLWTNSIAMCDIAATLRYVTPTIPDDELRRLLEGTQILPSHDLHAFTRRGDIEADFVNVIWNTAYNFLSVPRSAAERDAMVRAWKRIVFAHPEAFLTYRWKLFQRLVGLVGGPGTSPVYNWFTDIQDPYGSADKIGHDAAAGQIQNLLRTAMHWWGATPMFHVRLYLFLALLLLPFCVRDRESLALLLSGLSGEAILFLIAPTTDWRYSFWLILTTTIAIILLIARRRQIV